MKLAIAFLVETIDAAFNQLAGLSKECERLSNEVEAHQVKLAETRGDLVEALERVERYRERYGDLKE